MEMTLRKSMVTTIEEIVKNFTNNVMFFENTEMRSGKQLSVIFTDYSGFVGYVSKDGKFYTTIQPNESLNKIADVLSIVLSDTHVKKGFYWKCGDNEDSYVEFSNKAFSTFEECREDMVKNAMEYAAQHSTELYEDNISSFDVNVTEDSVKVDWVTYKIFKI